MSALAARGNHSLALLADGTVRAWGENFGSQLGIGSTSQQESPVPVKVRDLTDIVAIAAESSGGAAGAQARLRTG